jgi:hypothetical protein
MSTPISSVSSASSSNAAAYKEYLARLQAQKQQDAITKELKESSRSTPEPATPAPAASVDRDRDGD